MYVGYLLLMTRVVKEGLATVCQDLGNAQGRTLKKNLVYSFSIDSKSMFPPMHSIMALVMTNPKPVPLTFAAVWSAGCDCKRKVVNVVCWACIGRCMDNSHRNRSEQSPAER